MLQAETQHKLCFSLQHGHYSKPSYTKSATHNELRTRRPMW